MESFFHVVPCVTWKDWMWSFLYTEPRDPSILTLKKGPPLKSPTGTLPTAAKHTIEQARELSQFLGSYYYEQKSPYSLVVSPREILKIMEEEQAQVFVVYNSKKQLLACVFQFYVGIHQGQKMGLISWLCVHPEWRKKGIANLLFHHIEFHTTAPKINWFRNDAFFKSPLPPIYSSTMMSRKIRKNSSAYVRQQGQQTQNIEKTKFSELWKRDNPTGFILDDNKRGQIQYWAFKNREKALYALVQPTYEIKKTGERGCEILQIINEGIKELYEQTQIFEILVDALPYDYAECPAHIPHIESFWSKEGSSTWSVVGLNPGYPFTRLILPLLTA